MTAIPVAALGGCLASGGIDNTEETPTPATEDTPTPDTTVTPTPDPEDEIDRLPERSPLADQLVDLFVADDRAAFASDAGLNYRNGTVQVDISLEPDGDRPAEYLPEETSEYGDTIIAYVEVDDLVDLALEEDVRLVAPVLEPQPH